MQNCATATMQKLWEVQPQGLVLVLHPGQVQLCNCNNLKVAESTNWIIKELGLFHIASQYPKWQIQNRLSPIKWSSSPVATTTMNP